MTRLRWLVAQPTAAADTYRPDIDGLRGIAVLSVVIYHAFPAVLRSGFVGVDIFFVISGFLITSIIVADLERERFTFAHFYARRIRRIFPALLVVLAASFVFAFFYLLRNEFLPFAKQVAAASAFISNFAFWHEAGYFDTASEAKPLLHLWSLGVEEQFYLAWPLLLVLTWKRKRLFAMTLLVIAAASFIANVYLIAGSPDAAFFSPWTRFWELMVGAALAVAPFVPKHRAPCLSRTVAANVLTIGAAALLGYSFVAIQDASWFPGWWALLPVGGTALLIALPGTWLHRWVLQSQLLVWLGLVSYPLYLWHWPLLSFAYILDCRSAAVKASLAAASIVLAFLTWRFIEKPIRLGRGFPRAKVAGLAAGMTAAGLAGLLAWHEMLPTFGTGGATVLRNYTDDLVWTYKDNPRLRTVSFRDTDFAGAATLRHFMKRGDTDFHWIASNNPRKTLFIGDSHMEMYWPRVDQLIRERPDEARSAVFLTSSGFLPIPGVLVDPVRRPNFPGLADTMLSYALSDPAIDTVVISSLWGAHFVDANSYREDDESLYYMIVDGREQHLKRGRAANEMAFASFARMIRTLQQAGKKVYLLQSVTGGSTIVHRSWKGFELDAPPLPARDFLAETGPMRERIFRLGRETGAEVIDPFPSMCRDGLCPKLYDGVHPVYMDGTHLADRYARRYATFIDRTMMR